MQDNNHPLKLLESFETEGGGYSGESHEVVSAEGARRLYTRRISQAKGQGRQKE